MAHMKHLTLELPATTEGKMANPGTTAHNAQAMKEAFSQSPLFAATPANALTVESVRTNFNDTVLNGPLDKSGGVDVPQAGATGYWGLPADWSNSYADAPDVSAIGLGSQTGDGQAPGTAGGGPATPFVPNTASPNDGSVNPSGLPIPAKLSVETPGGGAYVGDLENPSVTSTKFGSMTLSDYLQFGELKPAGPAE